MNAPQVNSEGICWFRAEDGSVWRNERSRDGKSRMLRVWAWASDVAPTVAEKLLLTAEPDSAASAAVWARGKPSMPVMP